jgi:hypothetical protein
LSRYESSRKNVFFIVNSTNRPVPVAARSKVSVCGRLRAEIMGSNPTGEHGCLSVVSVLCC